MEGNEENILEEDYSNENFNDGGFEEDYSNEDINDEGFEEDYSNENFNDVDINASYPKSLGGIYSLFNQVLNKKDSLKVGNLNKEELGKCPWDIRGCLHIAKLGREFGHPRFAKFFEDLAEIISKTSMGKEGWFTELFVTSKKFASRESSSNISDVPRFDNGKWKMFSKNKS